MAEEELSRETRRRTFRLVLSPPPVRHRRVWPWAVLAAVILGWVIAR